MLRGLSFAILTLSAFVTLANPLSAQAELGIPEIAASMHEYPAGAADHLRARWEDDDLAAFYLIVVLDTWLPDTVETRAELWAVLAAVHERLDARDGDRLSWILEGPRRDDVADRSGVLSLLRALAVMDGERAPGDYKLTCETLSRNRSYLELGTSFFGSTLDNFLPYLDCVSPLPEPVEQYLSLIGERSDRYLWGPDSGTLRYAHGRDDQHRDMLTRSFPRALLNLEDRNKQVPNHRPLETWSMLSLANRDIYERYREPFDTALDALARHYRDAFGLSGSEALDAAGIALLIPALEGQWAPPQRSGLRYMILEGVPFDLIEAAILGAPSRDQVPMTLIGVTRTDAGWFQAGNPDPLISIAVDRPEALGLLLRHRWQDRVRMEGLARGDQRVDPNARNGIGKTPLMVAAERNRLRSARMLLDAGADPNLALDAPDLRHGRRTALLYAAASGSRSVIEALLDAGADPVAVDSLGFGVRDYLEGRGPTGANVHLSATDLAELAERFPATDRTRNGTTALMAAAADPNIWADAVRALLRAGSDPNTRDAEGLTALDHARRADPDGTLYGARRVLESEAR